MSIFDSFSKKMVDAGQKTVQKTKNVSEIARLNMEISQNKDILSNIYSELGKLYANKYKDQEDAEFSELLDAIKERENIILEINQRIMDLKGLRICPNCNSEVLNDYVFCSFCGSKMPEEEIDPDFIKCTQCDSLVKRGMNFCTNCGNKLNYSESNEVNDIKTDNLICPNCNSKVDDDSVFCTSCGTKL